VIKQLGVDPELSKIWENAPTAGSTGFHSAGATSAIEIIHINIHTQTPHF